MKNIEDMSLEELGAEFVLLEKQNEKLMGEIADHLKAKQHQIKVNVIRMNIVVQQRAVLQAPPTIEFD